MNKKILWKIEELWSEFYIPTKSKLIDVSSNYQNNISKYHPRFYMVDSLNFKESKGVIFEDAYGKYKGLEGCQVTQSNNKLVYLFDNHNEMLYPIVEISNVTGKRYDVVHIDAHPDDAEFKASKKTELEIENIKNYISETRISDFFDAISETEIIDCIYRVTHSDSLEFFLPPEKPYILSLDIDIFGPEGDFAELKDKVRAIAAAWGSADVVCIAMSPGFIDQEYAQKIIEIFIKQ